MNGQRNRYTQFKTTWSSGSVVARSTWWVGETLSVTCRLTRDHNHTVEGTAILRHDDDPLTRLTADDVLGDQRFAIQVRRLTPTQRDDLATHLRTALAEVALVTLGP